MSRIGLGKGQGFANKACQALTQGIEPTLDMTGLTSVLAHRLMAVTRENPLVGIPKITERGTTLVGQRDALPQLQATGLAAISDEVSHNLSGTTTQRHPQLTMTSIMRR